MDISNLKPKRLRPRGFSLSFFFPQETTLSPFIPFFNRNHYGLPGVEISNSGAVVMEIPRMRNSVRRSPKVHSRNRTLDQYAKRNPYRRMMELIMTWSD